MKCPKCKGEMEEGFLIPEVEIEKITWAKSLKTGLLGLPKVEERSQIVAHKCKNCGYVENYAK